VGRYAAYERFLRTAAIDQTTAAGPSSQHVFFKPGGLTAGASRKAEAYNLEIAGYRFDRLLSADLVPPTVEVDANGGRAAIQLWVENARPLTQVRSENLLPPDVAKWQAQLQRAYAFEDLVADLDEHEGSPIVDPHWNLIVLDHSHGFTNTLVLRYEVGPNQVFTR